MTVSKSLEKNLLNYGIHRDRIFVNPNGFDSEKFKPEQKDSNKCKKIRRKFDIDNKKVIIGFSGTFGLWHGIPQLIEAIDKIISKNMAKNLHFLIIGKGNQLKDKMISRLSKYNEVTFTGIIPYPEIQDYLAVCDVLISPHNLPLDSKEFFGSPTKIFEYMAMGKGIVASNLGQIGQTLENNKTAVLVKPGNVNELIKGIVKLVKDKELRKKLGKNASKIAFKKYTWDMNIKKLLTFMIRKKILSRVQVSFIDKGKV